MRIIPITLKKAAQFVDDNHRHCAARHCWKFGVGLEDLFSDLIGVGIAARPVASALDDGFCIEINRVCVLEGNKNANSMIYGALIRASKALGYTKIITYTLESESGSSLKAVGFIKEGFTAANRSWNSASKKLKHIRPPPAGRYPTERKIRWVID